MPNTNVSLKKPATQMSITNTEELMLALGFQKETAENMAAVPPSNISKPDIPGYFVFREILKSKCGEVITKFLPNHVYDTELQRYKQQGLNLILSREAFQKIYLAHDKVEFESDCTAITVKLAHPDSPEGVFYSIDVENDGLKYREYFKLYDFSKDEGGSEVRWIVDRKAAVVSLTNTSLEEVTSVIEELLTEVTGRPPKFFRYTKANQTTSPKGCSREVFFSNLKHIFRGGAVERSKKPLNAVLDNETARAVLSSTTV